MLATAFPWAGAWIGVALSHAAGRFLRPLVYLSLLFFAVVAIVDILPESKRALSFPTFASAVVAGYGIFWLIGSYVSPICPSCALRSFEDDAHGTHKGGLAVLSFVLAAHCFIDGLGIALVLAHVGGSFLYLSGSGLKDAFSVRGAAPPSASPPAAFTAS